MAASGATSVAELLAGVVAGQRSALARAITLVESSRPAKQRQARELMHSVMERAAPLRHAAAGPASFRIGFSGPPGAGKSTFIETFGAYVTGLQHKLAVLAVDPSSAATGGSLLGDKTRMIELSRNPSAYIRASPTGGVLGGVTRTTNETILLCEAAGYDIVLVETAGVGQTEFKVADMVDLFCLLLPPAGGDELQGMKKGIVEVSDLLVITKADGDLLPAARRIQSEYTSALKLLGATRRTQWRPRCLRVSAITKEGVPELWATMDEFRKHQLANGQLVRRRSQQLQVWMWNYISESLMQIFRAHPAVASQLRLLELQVAQGRISPGDAADQLLHAFAPDLQLSADTD